MSRYVFLNNGLPSIANGFFLCAMCALLWQIAPKALAATQYSRLHQYDESAAKPHVQQPDSSNSAKKLPDLRTDALEFSCTCLISEPANEGQRFQTIGELGEIEPSRIYVGALSLTNTTEQTIHFDRVESGCGCAKLTVTSGEIPPDESGLIGVELHTPPSNANSQYDLQFDFYDKGAGTAPVMSVRLTGRLRGNLYIERTARTIALGEGLSIYRIPVNFTKPITADTLVIEKSDSFRDINAELVVDSRGAGLVCTVHSEMLEGDGICGSITLRDKNLATTAAIELIFVRKKPVIVSPTEVYFTEDSGQWTATAILTLNEVMRSEEHQNELPQTSILDQVESISASSCGQVIELKSTRLGEKHFRLKLKADPVLFEKEDRGTLAWTVVVAGKREEFSSYWRVRAK